MPMFGTATRPPSSETCDDIVTSLVDRLDAMLAYWDAGEICRFANKPYLDWFGKTREQMIGIALSDLLGPLYPLNLASIRAAYAGEAQVFEREVRGASGALRHSLASYTPHVVDGKVIGIFVQVADVSKLKSLEQQLGAAKAHSEQQATHDPLTGLPNRVLLYDRIDQALRLARRSQRIVAGISIGLDDFKRTNDGFGHAADDRLLVEVATRLKQTIREIDTVSRIDGARFFLLLPQIGSRAEAEALALRLIKRIHMPMDLVSESVLPSCSLGIAFGLLTSQTPEEQVAESDAAQQEAKRLGKNRFVSSAAASVSS